MTAPRKRFLLRTDANPSVGYGHAVRCAALRDALGDAAEFVVAGDAPDELSAFFPGARVRSVGGQSLAAILTEERPDAAIVDLPRHDGSLWRMLRAHAPLVVAVDDEGGAVEADLVVNGAVPEACHVYPALPPGADALTGAGYTLLRPAFARTRWRDPESPRVTIVVGSGARARDWAFALVGDGLARGGWGDARMIVGRAFPMMTELRAACARAGVALLCGLDAQALADELACASVALITGGMIVPEALAVGTPAIVYPQIANLVPEARWFAARGALCDLGPEGGMNMGRVGHEVARLLRDRDTARKISARAKNLVDGGGAARAARAILARLAVPHLA